ncbi:MAG TPA: transposase [Planctomycetota bacterium]
MATSTDAARLRLPLRDVEGGTRHSPCPHPDASWETRRTLSLLAACPLAPCPGDELRAARGPSCASSAPSPPCARRRPGSCASSARCSRLVLSFPYPARLAFAYDARLCAAVRRILVRTLFGWHAGRAGVAHGRSGAIVVAQRFGSALNLNLHFHALVLDGIYASPDPFTRPRFHPAAPLTDRDVEEVTLLLQRRLAALPHAPGAAAARLRGARGRARGAAPRRAPGGLRPGPRSAGGPRRARARAATPTPRRSPGLPAGRAVCLARGSSAPPCPSIAPSGRTATSCPRQGPWCTRARSPAATEGS